MSIIISNLNKKFGTKTVLENIDLEFEDAHTTAILGHSGSGKSTLLRTLNLLETADSGTIKIENESIDFSKKISQKKGYAFRSHTAMVFQHFNLFTHLNAAQNIAKPLILVKKTPKNEAYEIALNLLEKVGLKDFANSYPATLSGGQTQRVAIARALAFKPNFLLLDEPTTALDPSLTNEVLKVIKELSEAKKSIIIVTHNLEFAKSCAHKIVFLDSGKIIFNGSKAEFFASNDMRVVNFIAGESFK